MPTEIYEPEDDNDGYTNVGTTDAGFVTFKTNQNYHGSYAWKPPKPGKPMHYKYAELRWANGELVWTLDATVEGILYYFEEDIPQGFVGTLKGFDKDGKERLLARWGYGTVETRN